jgi:putative transcriptional regulator
MTRISAREVRLQLKLSQPEFADRFGISLPTLREWEQGKKHPSGPAQTLLILISRIPDAVADAIRAA